MLLLYVVTSELTDPVMLLLYAITAELNRPSHVSVICSYF